MKQKRRVSMLGALIIMISAVVLITSCPQPNSNQGNKKSLDGILCTNGDYYYFSGGTIYDVEISGSSPTKRIASNYVGTECNFGGGNKLSATVTSDTVILNGTTWTIIKNDTLVQFVANAPVSP